MSVSWGKGMGEERRRYVLGGPLSTRKDPMLKEGPSKLKMAKKGHKRKR